MDSWDVVVVGGGAAGLSAALVLGRARQKTLVVDAGAQSNLPAHGIGGLLGHDGRPPAEFYASGRAELDAYADVTVRSVEVVDGELDGDGFTLTLSDASVLGAQRVLLATGMDYRYPSLPGLAERWGTTVFHCPFCHGWEVRDQPLGVLDRGASGVHRALLLRQWSDDVTLFADGPAELSDPERGVLATAGVAVEERRVAAVRGPLATVTFVQGGQRACGGLLVPVTLHQRSGLAAALGAVAAEPGPLAADAVDVDAALSTSVPGLSAAGDLSALMPSVANAIASGALAAAMLVGERATAPLTALDA